MNLFFYLQTFILNYSFIVILSDHIFCTVLCFIKTQPFVKRKPVNTKKIPERSRSVLGRFYCIIIIIIIIIIATIILRIKLALCTVTGFSSGVPK